jgi:2-methylcitrate dehydratase PrpD
MQAQGVDYRIEQQIAEHLASTSWDSLPEAARAQAVRAILWSLATGLEGATEPDQMPLLRYVTAQGGKTEATIFGTAQKTTAELAGLMNGRATKAWEHEDKYWADETIGFGVGCCVVPAAFAAAEVRGKISGRDLATAVTLGIDLEIRILRPLGLGFVPGRARANATFVLGTYGAAVAAAKIFGLDSAGFLDALGLAHSQASGNFQGQVEGRGVALQSGIAVRNGITAARLAAGGMPGPRASLTGSVGLYAVHYPDSKIDFAEIVKGLGTDFFNVKLGFKGYPCGVVAHPIVDAVLAARSGVGGREIKAIEVFGPPTLSIMASPIERKRSPRTAIEAQFSIPWAVACAMHDGYFSIEHFQGAAIKSADLQRLAGIVTIHMSAEARGNAVKVTLADGTTIQPPTVMASKGHPNNPLKTEEIEAVLLRAAKQLALREASVERALELMRNFDQVADVGEILALLSPQSA